MDLVSQSEAKFIVERRFHVAVAFVDANPRPAHAQTFFRGHQALDGVGDSQRFFV